MKRGESFCYYWIAVLFIITFTGYAGILLPRDHKNTLFLFGGLFSLIAFENHVNKEDLIPAAIISGLAIFNMHILWIPNAYMQSLFILVGMGVATQFFHHWNEATQAIIFKSLGWMCLLQAVWILLQYGWGVDLYFWLSGNNIIARGSNKAIENAPTIGSLGHWMVSGSFLVMTFPFVWEAEKRLIWLPILAAFVLPSGVPVASLIVVLAICAVYILRHDVMLVSGILLIAAVIALAIYTNTSILDGSERLKMWKYALFKFDINPIIGNGTGYMRDFFEHKFGEFFVEKHTKIHNDFISIYIHFGLVGLSILGYYIKRAVKRIGQEPLAAIALTCCIVPMGVGFIFHIASTSIVFIIIMTALLHNDSKLII